MIEYDGPNDLEHWTKFLSGEYISQKKLPLPPKKPIEYNALVAPLRKIFLHISYIVTHNPVFALAVLGFVILVGMITYKCSMRLESELDNVVRAEKEQQQKEKKD